MAGDGGGLYSGVMFFFSFFFSFLARVYNANPANTLSHTHTHMNRATRASGSKPPRDEGKDVFFFTFVFVYLGSVLFFPLLFHAPAC